MTAVPTSDILYRAADLIEERGWGQGAKTWGIGKDDSPLCLEGAIGAALGKRVNVLPSEGGIWTEDLNVCPAASAVHDYLGWRTPYLYDWNDAHDRTEAEVIATLRACAVIEAAKERAASDLADALDSAAVMAS